LKLKYLQVIPGRVIPPNIKACLEEQPARSGLYNWIFAHQGDYGTFWDHMDNKFEDYDVVQVNMSPIDMTQIPDIRRLLRGSSTKLVLNNDYVCERWDTWGLDPFKYQALQRMGDMVFSTEPHQVSNMINGTYTIPHPTNTKVLKHLGTNQDENSVGFIYHWWAQSTYTHFLTMEKVRKKYGIKKATMFGETKGHDDKMERWRDMMFHERVPLISFPQFAQRLMAEKCIYDPNPYHTYGRNGVELACFKRPVVGSNRVFSYNYLWKGLSCSPFDAVGTMEKFDTVFKNKEKVQEIIDRAYEQVEFFNYKNSRERFMAALDDATDRGGTDYYQKYG